MEILLLLESFKQAFGVTLDGDKYGGTLAIASLSLANEVRDIVGVAQAIIAIYKNCKMMLLPIPAYQILIGFVLRRSVNQKIIASIIRLKDYLQRPLNHNDDDP